MVEKPMFDMNESRVDHTHNHHHHQQHLHMEPDMYHTEQHHQPMPGMPETEASICAGCGGKIVDRYYLLAVDKQWHVSCLKCVDCNLRLDSELTCFAKDGCIYCKDDYYRRFGVKRCSRCHLGISAHELVMRARDLVYHLGCFTCATCNKALTTGDHFGMKENMIYCRAHYEFVMQGDYIPSLSPGLNNNNHHGNHIPFYNGVGAVQKGRPRKRKSPGPDAELSMQLGLGPNENMGLDQYSHQSARQKRVRTSFKHHQLRTMKSYFNLNHNPDAKDLKQLAQKTGLTKRVLQVWFQNARAKYRRNILRQESETGKRSENSENGSNDNNNSLNEMSTSASPAISDISSSASLSDLHHSGLDQGSSLDDQSSTGSTLTELFSNSINSMN